MGVDGRRLVKRLGVACVGLIVLCSGVSILNAATSAEAKEFATWQSGMQKEFIDYTENEKNEYAAFKASVEQKWLEFVGSTKKDWVEYSEDMSSRSIVDFKKGEINLEVIIPLEELGPDVDKKAMNKAKEALLRKAAKARIKARLKAMLADKSAEGKSPVEGQIQNEDGENLSKNNVEMFVEKEIDKNLEIETKPYVAKDGKKRLKAKVKVKMVPDHLKVRAEKYKKSVEKYAKRYDLDPALVYAVIHTESYFNPKARSHVPAYGLMQLVPSSGGLDAYRYVKGKDQKPSPSYLYKPSNNIELGAGYLALLGEREFKKVKNEATKKYLVISSYNTGAGNVSRAFEGRKKLRATVDRVNQMSPDEVYAKLVRDLPYEETRHYIQKVVDREKLYKSL